MRDFLKGILFLNRDIPYYFFPLKTDWIFREMNEIFWYGEQYFEKVHTRKWWLLKGEKEEMRIILHFSYTMHKCENVFYVHSCIEDTSFIDDSGCIFCIFDHIL